MKYLKHLTVICIFFSFYSCSHQPITSIANLNSCDSETFIRNWEFTKPYILDSYMANNLDANFNDLNSRDQGDNIPDYYSFTKLFNNLQQDSAKKDTPDFSRFICHQSGSYIEVDTLFNSYDDRPKSCYAVANIKSDAQQDVAFFAGASAGLQLWVNQKLVLKRLSHEPINGYQYPLKVHLNKGENFILAKLTNISGDWKFFLKISSVKYAIENSLGANFSSICKNYLIPVDSALNLKIWSPFISLQKSFQLKITDQHNKVVLNKSFAAGSSMQWPLKNYEQGAYSIELRTDSLTLKQKFFYGDYHQYFNRLEQKLKPLFSDRKVKGNVNALLDRFKYTDTVNVTHDNAYERKVAINLFELTEIYNHLSSHLEAFKDVPGLHIRAQADDDHKADSYMVYIPEKYNKNKPLPLLVMMPHETGIRHFNISTYVSDINRIEHICKLADKYGIGVLWSSFKVYNHHNLTNMIPKTVFETVNDVRKDYNIDTSRLYAYGDCAGGELALFTANRYPSYFAAVAVEGPAIPSSKCDDDNANCVYDSKGELAADFYNTIENYKNFPVCIFHSIADEKADIEKSRRLIRLVSSQGGQMELREIHVKKGSDRFYFFMNLMPDNYVLTNMFKFYHGKQTKLGDTINFATWELKYNKAYWLTIDDKAPDKKATVEAVANPKDNEVDITTTNINRLTLDLAELARIHIDKNLRLFINGKLVKNVVLNDGHLSATLSPVKKSPFVKNEFTEGPQNDFFSSPFMIVKGTKGSIAACRNYAAAIDTFKANWGINFLEDTCRIKNDVDVTQDDISRYNLIIVGTDNTNALLSRIAPDLPLKIKPDQVVLANKKYEGNDLSFTFIYPNPLNKKKYILVAGGNAPVFYAGMIKDILFSGWSDYVINAKGYPLASGYFSPAWQ